MKIFFTALILLASSLSLAQENGSWQAETYQRNHSWFCMAEGTEPSSGRSVQTSGDNKPTLAEAQQSAVQRCMQLGWMGCRYSTCIDEGGY